MFGDMSVIQVFQTSPTMLVLLVCSIVTVGFSVERLLYFCSSRSDVRRFMAELANFLKAGNPRAALEFCQRQNTPVARLMTQGVVSMNRTAAEQVQRLDTAIELEQVEMERNLGVLGTMATIAPLLGLFGTVVGIIRAFADIARTGSGGGAVVAMGVSEALLTTAAGIVVAVVATVFYNVFVRRIRARIAQLEDAREVWLALTSQYVRRRASADQPAGQRATTEQPQPVGVAG
ncbi:MAG: MotA/TolQ/ExbB proton channel family protein [Candidatus Krumholzibacteria bacterium]|jgi:biopolymer transport protein ExbB|nr:MotA/TolQ/ExbB proton channel family protein [Candidatus Krumholzibacteria bacterium]